MKIAILFDELSFGSSPKILGQTYRELTKLGHQCDIILLVDNGNYERFPEIYDYHLEGIPIRYLLGKRKWWDIKFLGFSFFSLHHLIGFLAMPIQIKKGEYDVVLANSSWSLFPAWGMKLFQGTPYVYYAHCDPSIHNLKKSYGKTWMKLVFSFMFPFAYLLDKLGVKFANATLVSGILHKERFAKIESKNLEIIRYGCVPNEEFTPFSQRDKAIITFDRWDVGYSPLFYLNLLQQLDESIHLKIGGLWHPTWLEFEFMERVVEMDLQKRVHFLGALDESRIIKHCSNSIVHVHANQEAFGMPTLEAGACGCVTLIPQGSGASDLFQWMPTSMDKWVQFLDMIFNDIEYAERIGKTNWRIAKEYTWGNYAKRLDEVIRKYVVNPW